MRRAGPSRLVAPGAILAAALLWGLFVLGGGAIDIHNRRWLCGDLADFYIAWTQYTSDPDAHWLMSRRMSDPLEMNFALFDSMPLFLLTVGKLAPLVPDRTQYLGLYFVACLLLQGLLGYFALGQLLRESGQGRWQREFVCALGGLFFVLAPFTFFRFQQHAALSSQWVLALSIFVGLRSIRSQSLVWQTANGAVAFLVSGLNPYLAFMVLLSETCLLLGEAPQSGWRFARRRIASLFLVTMAGFYIFGFFVASSVDAGGYGKFSMNALGPADSNALGNLFAIDVADATGGQSLEGFNYLGLGVLALVAFSPFFVWSTAPSRRFFPYKTALAVIVISYLLSLSTTVSASSWSFHLPAPSFVEAPLSALRCSGRLFWIGGFWLILTGVASAYERFGAARSAVLLLVLFVVQLVDVAGVAAQVRGQISSAHPQRIRDADLGIPIDPYRSIIVLPSWACDSQRTPGGVRGFEEFGFLAADHRMNTNDFYAARFLAEQAAFHCDVDRRLERPDARAIYVLAPSVFDAMSEAQGRRLSCASILADGSRLCVLRPAVPDARR